MTKSERALLKERGELVAVNKSQEPYFRYKGGNEWFILEVINEGEGALPLFKVQSAETPTGSGNEIVETYTHKFFQI